MSIFEITVTFVILFGLEVLYFYIARKFKIVDKPNQRSSHSVEILRGGGIIFSISLLFTSAYFGLEYQYFLLGLALIAFVSFLDDISPLSNRIRITIHFTSVILLFYQINLFELPYFLIFTAFILVIGTINAINFMDGINGITGSYALVTLLTLLYVNMHVVEFVENRLLIISVISVIVFNIFNFRTKAICFAGDVGSISIAYIIIFFLLRLILKTENITYILVLLIYGLDSISTILFRIIRKENIFDAHRTHYYQFLVNEKRWPHLLVATIYSITQLLINMLLASVISRNSFVLLVAIVLIITIFIMLRFATEGRAKLLGNR